MILLDVNILVTAHREDSPLHRQVFQWLTQCLKNELVGFSELAFSGFLRIVTHPKVFNPPSSLEKALQFVTELREHPQAMTISPGPKHFEIFMNLCQRTRAKGNLIPDAFFAALAIESGTEWITLDGDFSRFPGLKWRHPLPKNEIGKPK